MSHVNITTNKAPLFCFQEKIIENTSYLSNFSDDLSEIELNFDFETELKISNNYGLYD